MSPRAFPRSSLIVLVSLSLASGQPEVVETPGASSAPDWSKVVGASYPYRADCKETIEQYLTLDQPGLPVPPDAASGAGAPPSSPDNLKCYWDVFAWNTFAALNWPGNTALGKRGLPSASTTFLRNKDNTAEVVWEAFKEKRELFQENPSTHWNDIEHGKEVKRFKKPANVWSRYGGYCSPADQRSAGTASSGPFAADKFHNQLDETAEVQSQALEPRSELCQGYSESDCQVTNESVVGPRVWMGDATTGRPLYYEVKVNYDFFDYVMHPPQGMALPSSTSTLVDDEVAATYAMLNLIRLPWRSAAPVSPGYNNQKAVFNYGSAGSCKPFDGTPESGVANASVPCRTGAVHMKTAWVKLTEAEIAESPPRYHTTTALYYETPPPPDNKSACIAVDTFGLVGLHAIQRVMVDKPGKPGKPGTPDTPSNPGGAFVFATWEHRSILDPSYAHPQKFEYVNLLTNPLFGSTKAGDPYPTRANALTVSRMVPTNGDPAAETTCGLSAQQTCQVNEAALAKLTAAGSVWANYRLVGTQFAPYDCKFTEGDAASEAKRLAQCRYDTLFKLGQPHFLANVVIETNQGLQHFLGLPPEQPRLQPQNWCARSSSNKNYCDNRGTRLVGPNTKFSSGHFIFDRGANNMTYGGNAMNMGGCQGCHGVAQQNGYSFSFVLLDGVNGAKADTEDDADIPATALAQSVPVWLQSFTDRTKFLTITKKENAKFKGYHDLELRSQSQATQWRLQPYTGSAGLANFGGRITVADTGGRGVLQLGQVGSGVGPPIGTPTSALVGPSNTGSISRPFPEQTVFLVAYTPPTPPNGVPKDTFPFSLVSSAPMPRALQAEAGSGAVTAQRPAAIPSGSTLSTALLEQVFNIVVVPD
jgi:hypothetical protein